VQAFTEAQPQTIEREEKHAIAEHARRGDYLLELCGGHHIRRIAFEKYGGCSSQLVLIPTLFLAKMILMRFLNMAEN